MKNFNGLDKARVQAIIRAALKEDIGRGDITTLATVTKFTNMKAGIVARDSGVVCGLPVVEMILNMADCSIRVKPTVNEGDYVSEGKEVVYLEGRARPILMSERTILNFLGHLSGIATRTSQFVEKVKKYNVKIMDTRKTTPLLRHLEKYAVRIAGGHNHRMGLWDQLLIKDNHIKVAKAVTLKDIISNTKKRKQRNVKLEVEVSNLKEFEEALEAGPDIIMLDNMTVEDVRKAAGLRVQGPGSRVQNPELEVSGGITLDNVEEYAASGVDMISVGSLTKDVRSFDMALEVVG